MKHKLVFWESARLFYVRAEGRAALAGFRSITEELFGDPRLFVGVKVLIDYRAVEFAGIGVAEVHHLVEILKPYEARLEGVRVVSVVASPLHFAMTRMWEALAEVADFSLAHQVTFELDEALKYLGLDDRLDLREELDRLMSLGVAAAEAKDVTVARDDSTPVRGAR